MMALPEQALAGDFRLIPIMLDFPAGVKSGVITLINEGVEKNSFQLTAAEWLQDKDGKDSFVGAPGLIYYPKIVTIDPGQRQVIRIGLKGPVSAVERTYRLFIEEMPDPQKVKKGVSVLIRFGAPLFVKPANEVLKGTIEHIALSHGTVSATVKNSGTVHFRIKNVVFTGKSADGNEIFSQEVEGWYLLHDASRPYQAAIPSDVCRKLSTIEINVDADILTLHERLGPITQEMCRP